MEKARRLRGVRVAMLAAAFLAVSAGFGLHPEPGSNAAGSGPGLHGVTVAEGGASAHDCLACRAHRPLVLSPTPAEVVGAGASTALLSTSPQLAIRAFPLLRLDGRSPPATS